MDRILVSSGHGKEIQVTNDGATILRSVGVDNPAAKVLVDISKVQDDQISKKSVFLLEQKPWVVLQVQIFDLFWHQNLVFK